jgi:hypothetical protein
MGETEDECEDQTEPPIYAKLLGFAAGVLAVRACFL